MNSIEALIRQNKELERRIGALSARRQQASPTGWLELDTTWTYASGTTFTITDDTTITDYSEHYQAGDWIRFKQGAGYLYGCITVVAYADPTTTITISGDTIADATITDNALSKVLNPTGMTLEHFDADQFGSGAATDDYVLTADGSGGAAWEEAAGGGLCTVTGYVYDATGQYTDTSWATQNTLSITVSENSIISVNVSFQIRNQNVGKWSYARLYTSQSIQLGPTVSVLGQTELPYFLGGAMYVGSGTHSVYLQTYTESGTYIRVVNLVMSGMAFAR